MHDASEAAPDDPASPGEPRGGPRGAGRAPTGDRGADGRKRPGGLRPRGRLAAAASGRLGGFTGPDAPAFDVSTLFGQAWTAYWPHAGRLAAATALAGLAAVALFAPALLGLAAVVGLLEDVALQDLFGPDAQVLALLALSAWGGLITLAMAGLQSAVYRLGLAVARDEPWDVVAVFRPGTGFVPFLLTTQLLELLVRLGCALCVAPGVILFGGLALAPLLALDRGLGPLAALQASWNRTEGAKATLVFTYAAASVLGLGLTLFTFGLGLLAVLPFTAVLYAVCYERLTTQRREVDA